MNYRFLRLASVLFVLFNYSILPGYAHEVEKDEIEEELSEVEKDIYAGAKLRLGAFNIFDIDSRIYFGPEDLPLAVPVSLVDELGFKSSLWAARGAFSYRFNKHHALTVGYYRFEPESTQTLSRTVELGATEFEIGFDVVTRYTEDRLKLSYDFIFHDEGKTLLSASIGTHFTSAELSIGIEPDLVEDAQEDASVAAPLPMLGMRVAYRMSPKWSLAFSSDLFFLTDGNQEGSLSDTSILFEYKTDSWFGFGGGINRYALDLDLIDSGNRWDWQSSYWGSYIYMTINF